MTCTEMIIALENKLRRKLTLEEKKKVQEKMGHVHVYNEEDSSEEMLVVA